jgi:hypothetical protein
LKIAEWRIEMHEGALLNRILKGISEGFLRLSSLGARSTSGCVACSQGVAEEQQYRESIVTATVRNAVDLLKI